MHRPITLRTFLLTNGLLLLLAALILVSIQGVWAAPLAADALPSRGMISYQGQLTDTNNQPVNGTQRMRFALYPSANATTPLWEEEWSETSAIQVVNGQFSVLLGSQSPITPNAIAGAETLFLGVQVGDDDEMQPRLQLGGSPFAIQASQALTVPDGSIGSAQIANGSVTSSDLANNSVGSAQIADGAVTSSDLANGSVTNGKTTITTYSSEDGTPVTVSGQSTTTLSEFQFSNVPAGDVVLNVTLTGIALDTNRVGGTVWVEVGGTTVAHTVMHTLKSGNHTQLTLHGRIPSFAGGNLVLQVKAVGEAATVNVRFGEPGDGRFGRNITLIAGL